MIVELSFQKYVRGFVVCVSVSVPLSNMCILLGCVPVCIFHVCVSVFLCLLLLVYVCVSMCVDKSVWCRGGWEQQYICVCVSVCLIGVSATCVYLYTFVCIFVFLCARRLV